MLTAGAVVALGLVVAALVFGAQGSHSRLAAASPTPVCDSACLAHKAELTRQLATNHRLPEPASPLPATVPAGFPTWQGPTGIPWDACSTVLKAPVVPTVAQLVKLHGTPTGCGADYTTASGQPCIRLVLAGPNLCPTSPLPQMLVWVQVPGSPSGDPRPGFLTCERPAGATPPVCGVDQVTLDARADRSANWVFSPFPDSATPLPWPATAGAATPTASSDPVGACVSDGQTKWAFYVASHTYTPGCPPPWG